MIPKPTVMFFGDCVELSFSSLWDGYESDAQAKETRDAVYHDLKRIYECKRGTLRNQMRQYASLGVYDGRTCDVYKLRVVVDPLISEGQVDQFVDVKERTFAIIDDINAGQDSLIVQ